MLIARAAEGQRYVTSDMKTLALLIVCLALVTSTSTKSFQLKTEDTNTQTMLRSAGVTVDAGRRKFSVKMDVKNIGTKSISAIRWEFIIEDGSNGDILRTVMNGGTIFKSPLSPNKHRQVRLVTDQTIKPAELDESLRKLDDPRGLVRIVALQFSDGSHWIAPSQN